MGSSHVKVLPQHQAAACRGEAEGKREEALIAALGLGEAGPALGLGFGVELFEVRGPH